MIPVVWITFTDGLARGHWHDEMLGDLFDRKVWRPVNGLEYRHRDGIQEAYAGEFMGRLPGEPWPPVGEIVVISGAENADHVADLNRYLSRLAWCLVIIAGDENHLFPRDEIDHPRCEVWAQCTRPGDEQRALGFGYPPGTREGLAAIGQPARTEAWSFVGQVTHSRRFEMLEAARAPGVPPGVMKGTEHFAAHLDGSGMTRDSYLYLLALSLVVLCPSGPHTPDSFRLYEALEAGCIPLADAKTPSHADPGYWSRVFDGQPEFPMLGEWESLVGWLDHVLADATAMGARISAWYQGKKRDLAYELDATVRCLATAVSPPQVRERNVSLRRSEDRGSSTEVSSLADLISVVVTTSPTPLHPSTEHIEETVASIRAQLPDSEIIIVADGVRPEQEDRRADYDEYLARLTWLCNLRWSNVLPILMDDFVHQANCVRAALEQVRTPLVLLVEHDTPLVGEIDWAGCAAVVRGGAVNVVRFHHEAQVLDVHQYLMLDREPRLYRTTADAEAPRVPLLRTVQWSQRPHLAPTLWYREMLDRFFAPEGRTFVEDVLYGKVENAWLQYGEAGWEQWRVAMYAPPLPLKRSEHLDSRGDDEKYPIAP